MKLTLYNEDTFVKTQDGQNLSLPNQLTCQISWPNQFVSSIFNWFGNEKFIIILNLCYSHHGFDENLFWQRQWRCFFMAKYIKLSNFVAKPNHKIFSLSSQLNGMVMWLKVKKKVNDIIKYNWKKKELFKIKLIYVLLRWYE